LSLADYALIGDCRCSALVSRSGSIDWLCLPRPDSPSIFARILDDNAGCLAVRPAGTFASTRRYMPGTNVLETTFRCPDGVVQVRDAMPVAGESEPRPQHELLREIAGIEGSCRMEVLYEPRPDYARQPPRLVDRGAWGIWCAAGRDEAILRSDLPLAVQGTHASGGGVVRAGEIRHLSFSYATYAPAVVPPLGPAARQRMARSVAWWQDWSARCAYDGRYREAVLRSVLVLKLLSYAPTGAILAAPTTSLPEEIGGVRNWDYRYCWLRDASLTIRALLELGYEDEAAAFCAWLLHTTRLSLPDVNIVYDVFGRTELAESELPHLAGCFGSRPVRIGNGAVSQFQLDVYGELLDAVAHFLIATTKRLDRDTRRMLEGLGATVCRRWQEPDEGIWEVRGGRFQHTHSKALAWVALDRLLRMAEAGLLSIPKDHFKAVRDAVRAEIETRGWNEQLGSYVRTFGGDELDASLLLLPMYGYADAQGPRMRSTIERTVERLGAGPFLYRYAPGQDGVEGGGEGAFGIACFWAVEALARSGQASRAQDMFERLLQHANDVGLYGEELDPATGQPLGNFPQAFTHVGLINAALAVEAAQGTRKEGQANVNASV
jgi:GH15 family glucan-1,4-alpha-glucosidase